MINSKTYKIITMTEAIRGLSGKGKQAAGHSSGALIQSISYGIVPQGLPLMQKTTHTMPPTGTEQCRSLRKALGRR